MPNRATVPPGALLTEESPSLTPEQRVTLRPLSIAPHREGALVGDPGAGEFILVPEIGRVIIAALREGRSMRETADVAREHAGVEVDVIEFIQTLIELGFVASIDARPLPDPRDRHPYGGRAGEWLMQAARPLLAPGAWLIYATLFLACIAALAADPRLRPRGRDLLFLPHDPVASVAIMVMVGTALAGLHECAHWLAGRAAGVGARISLSRRWYLLVLQTDLTGIWALPRARRLGPLLAGMALDSVRLACLLAARITADTGLWQPPPLLARVLIALIATTVVGLAFQFMIFLRTDLYAVLVTWLDCVNLTRITQLSLKRTIGRLTTAERAELTDATSRDLAVARCYRWIYLAGIVFASWFFLSFFGPNIITVAGWTATNLQHASPTRPDFWQALILGTLALSRIPLTILVFIRDRRFAGREADAGKTDGDGRG